MPRRCLAVLPVAVFALLGCDTLGIDRPTEVRIENASAHTFDVVSYWAGSRKLSYDSVSPGEATPFVEAEVAYGFTTVQVMAGADTLRMQVIDYVGEEPLRGGRYTYVLTLEGEPGSRSLGQTLRTDR